MLKSNPYFLVAPFKDAKQNTIGVTKGANAKQSLHKGLVPIVKDKEKKKKNKG
jgi:hypothetical protein